MNESMTHLKKIVAEFKIVIIITLISYFEFSKALVSLKNEL